MEAIRAERRGVIAAMVDCKGGKISFNFFALLKKVPKMKKGVLPLCFVCFMCSHFYKACSAHMYCLSRIIEFSRFVAAFSKGSSTTPPSGSAMSMYRLVDAKNSSIFVCTIPRKPL